MTDKLKRQIRKLQAENSALQFRISFLEAIIDELPNPVFAKREDASFCLFNKAYEEFFSVNRKDLMNLSVLNLEYINQEDREKYQLEDIDAINQCKENHYETKYETDSGDHYALYWTKGLRVQKYNKKCLVGMIVDISRQKKLELELEKKIVELEQANAEITRISQIDPLTGLANRRMFIDRLENNIGIANRHNQPLCVIMADLDYFKKVNDSFGHDHGDGVLTDFARILKNNCRKEDTAARLGGEEFYLLLPMTQIEDASLVAERIRMITEKEIILPDGHPQTVSIGTVEYISHETVVSFLKRVDDALYRAKAGGRNMVCQ